MTREIGEQTVNRFSIFYEIKTFCRQRESEKATASGGPGTKGLEINAIVYLV